MLLLLLGSPAAEYLPCRPGITIEYRHEKDGADTGTRVVDVVVGEERRLCRIDRTTKRKDGVTSTDGYLREVAEDRVLAAGYAGAEVALRPPILVDPVNVGTAWQFNRSRYRIAEVGPCRILDREETCAVVERSGIDAAARARVTYALGIGMVEEADEASRLVAVRVEVPKGESRVKTRAAARD
jgi:hypothetical protein